MQHVRIEVVLGTVEHNSTKTLVIDAKDGVYIADGVAHFRRTEDGRHVPGELLAAPLTSILYWN